MILTILDINEFTQCFFFFRDWFISQIGGNFKEYEMLNESQKRTHEYYW